MSITAPSPVIARTVQMPLQCVMCRKALQIPLKMDKIKRLTGCPAQRILFCPIFTSFPGLEHAIRNDAYNIAPSSKPSLYYDPRG